MAKNHSFLFRNGLSITFLLLMIFSLGGQIYTGWLEHNEFLNGHGRASQSLNRYLISGHFFQATFENWESEFFQMTLFVVFTIFLRQQGSSESKDCDEESFNKEDLTAKKDSPGPVKRGGLALELYKHSLSISLLLLFLFSFFFHWYGSWLDFNEKQEIDGKNLETFTDYISNKKLWFESFQNWQSEFLSIFSIIFLSIYLRQYGSSQSKPVNAAHNKAGD